MADVTDWSDIFDRVFSSAPSGVEAEIWREAFGDEYPAEVQPYSYTTRSELADFVLETHLSATSLLVDVGCGRGGPGLWVAAASGASLLGVDISSGALAAAQQRADALALSSDVRFVLGDFASIPLGDNSAAALMSVDALLFAPDKASAAREIYRVLEPGGRFVATTWDYHRQPVGRPPQVSDHRPLLVDAGFEIDRYDDTPRWLYYQRRTNDLMLERVDELAREEGVSEDELRASLLEMDATFDTMIRRVFIVATKPFDHGAPPN